jgi:hypothetical protein
MLLSLTVLPVVGFVVATTAVAQRFGLPPFDAAHVTMKAATLRVIDGAVRIYDPVAARIADFGPSHELALHSHVRAEQFFGANGLGVMDAQNATIRTSPFPFRYQPYDESRLQELRRKYGLDAIVAGAPTEFDAMVRLRSWTRTQFRRRDYQPLEPNFDAVKILDRRLRNDADLPYDPSRHMDPCYFFPMFYTQVMLAAGYQGRLVSTGHGITEVWSNQHRKWVAMDAELDLHYEKDGTPLSMMDMHNENFGGDAAPIRIVRGTQRSGDANTTMVFLNKEELSAPEVVRQFRDYIEITDMRNDWWSNHYFRGHPARSERSSLVYFDPRLNTAGDARRLTRPSTSREADLYWTLDETEIWVRGTSPARQPTLVFRTVTPNFDHFDVTVDGQRSMRLAGETLEWALHSGINTLSVTSVNKFGVKGIPSAIRLEVRR